MMKLVTSQRCKMNAGTIVLKYKKMITNKNQLSDEDKVEILSKIVTKKEYVDYRTKQSICKEILSNNLAKKNERLIYDSSEIYYKFVLKLLYLYFDLDEDEHTYNSLSSYGLLGFMLVLISDEYQMFKGILDSYINDLKNGNLGLEDIV